MNLCQLAGDWRGDLPRDGAMIEQKMDGFRALRFRGIDGRVRLFTRGGIPIEGTAHILHQLDKIERAAGEALFIDGEYQVDGTLAATKAWCERGWKGGGEAGQFFAFDAMPYREWLAGGCAAPLYQRKARLHELAKAAEADSWDWRPGSRGRDELAPPAVVVLPDFWAADAADVIDEARRVWADHGEGVVVKDPMAPYRRLRSDAWQKVKRDTRAVIAMTRRAA